MTETATHREIVDICQRLHQKNMLAATDGNVSFRVSDEEILITPSGMAKAFMTPEQMAVINISGDLVKGQASSEMDMHLAVYRNSPKAKAVIHAHPPHAVAWSIAKPDLKELPASSLSEVILAVGKIPFAKYARPGSKEMGEVLLEHLPQCRVMILSNHGALSWGESLEEAYFGMERLEASCQILTLAEQLGGIHPLPDNEIEVLKQMREDIGDRTL